MEKIKQHWRQKEHKRWRIIAIVSLLTVILIRYAFWSAAINTNTRVATENFNSAINISVTDLQNRFETYSNILYAGRALFLTDKAVSRQDWQNFIEAQAITQRSASVEGIGYASAINQSQSGNLTTKLNTDRLPSETKNIAIYPQSDDQQLVVLTYLSPQESTNQNDIGYDFMTNQGQASMLDQARDSGRPQTSVPLSVINEPSGASPSLLMALPVYAAVPLNTTQERRTAMTGYIMLYINPKTLLDSLFNTPVSTHGIALTITTDNQILYHIGVLATGQHLQKTITVNVAGQVWTLAFNAPFNLKLSPTAKLAPTIILISALPIAIMLGIIIYYAISLVTLRKQRNDT
jgi:CHASE1-domain containing sensor protein